LAVTQSSSLAGLSVVGEPRQRETVAMTTEFMIEARGAGNDVGMRNINISPGEWKNLAESFDRSKKQRKRCDCMEGRGTMNSLALSSVNHPGHGSIEVSRPRYIARP